MAGSWQENIVRIVGSDGAVIGTGTLFDTAQKGICVLTCAHVLNQVLGRDPYSMQRPAEDVVFGFDIPVRSQEFKYEARLIEWSAPRKSGDRVAHPVCDMALLKVSSEIPSGVRLYSADDFTVRDMMDQPVESFGFSTDPGQRASGRLMVKDAGGWFHFAGGDASATFVEPGFSGAPLFDEHRSRIVGMVVAVLDDSGKQVAYAQPAENIWKGCPQLARPYLGLKDFEEEDAAFFFGREAFVETLRKKLEGHAIAGVTAASGSGKSSVIKAGLVPLLRRELRWCIITMRPARDPWKQLAEGLLPYLYPGLDFGSKQDKHRELTKELRGNPDHLKERLRGLAGDGNEVQRVLIFVDQFEELFTQAGHTGGRQSEETGGSDAPAAGEAGDDQGETDTAGPGAADFRDWMVATASVEDDLPVQWLYTLRADFAGAAFRHRAFVDLLRDGDVKLADMTEAELRRSITCPAEELGATFEDGVDGGPSVSERIADAVEARPGTLPLMAHLLEKLWERLDLRQITHEAYDGLGGLEGALNRHADMVYTQRLTKEQQFVARRLFSRLVKIEEGNEPTRHVQTREALGEDLWEVADILARQRLLVIHGSAGPSETEEAMKAGAPLADNHGQQTVEVAHEVLLRRWGRFRTWLREDLGFLLWRQRLERRIDDWKELDRSDNELLQNERLQEANSWTEQRRDDLTDEEQDYIRLSKEKADKDARAKKQAEREEAERRAAEQDKLIGVLSRQRRWAIAAIAMLAIALLGGGWAYNQIIGKNNQLAIAEAEAVKLRDDALALAASEKQQRQIAQRSRDEADKAKVDALSQKVIADKQRDLAEQRKASALAQKAIADKQRALAEQRKLDAERDAARYAAAIAAGQYDLGKDHWALMVARNALPARFTSTLGEERPNALLELLRATARMDLLHGELRGHEDDITAVAFSPDGNYILTGSSDNTARLWETSSGRQLHVLQGHDGNVVAVAFSPDGRRILTGSWDGTARLWEISSGRQLRVLQGHERNVTVVAFSPDGSSILTGSWDHTARLWDSANGLQLYILQGHDDYVTAVAFSPNGSQILTGSLDGTARLWEASNEQQVHVLQGHDGPVTTVAFSPDGSHILTGSWDYTARTWEASNGRQLHVLQGHEHYITAVAFSPDGSHILTGSLDGTARLWEASSGRQLNVLSGHERIVNAVAISPDGSRILTGSGDDTARLWEASSGRQLNVLRGHKSGISTIAFSPDGSKIFTGSDDDTARLWEASSGRQLNVLSGHEQNVNAVAISPDGSRILTGSDDDTARLWEASSGRLLYILQGHDGPITDVAFSPDGSRILTGSKHNDTVRLWETSSGRQLHVLRGHEGSVFAMAFSPDGNHILTGSEDDTARLWETSSGRQLHVLEGHESIVTAVAFSPSGSHILTGSWDDTARLWETSSGRQLHVLEGHESIVTAVAFSPSGSHILTGSWDDTARIWEASNGRQLHVLHGHENDVTAVAFSPDGSRILTGSTDDAARLWEASSGQQLHVLRGQENSSSGMTFSPDGSSILTGFHDNTARIWEASSGRQLYILQGHEFAVTAVAFSPDGSRILTGSVDNSARIWNVAPPDPETRREEASAT